jgi:hypothetical protein
VEEGTGLADAALHVAVASRVFVVASSNGPGGYFSNSEIVFTEGYIQNYWSPALAIVVKIAEEKAACSAPTANLAQGSHGL